MTTTHVQSDAKPSTADVDLAKVDAIIERIGRDESKVIPILQAIEEEFRYLPKPAIERVCEISDVAPAQIVGVSTFYTQFRHRPMGEHLIRVCHGTACHVKGAPLITDALSRYLHLPPGEDTDEKGLFTLAKVACLGCCTLAPVVQIEDVTYGHLTPDRVPGMLKNFLELDKRRASAQHREAKPEKKDGLAEIRISLDSCCIARGCGLVRDALEEALVDIGAPARIKRVGCVGMCYETPLVEIVMPDGSSFLYAQVKERDAAAILRRHFGAGGLIKRIGGAVSRFVDNIFNEDGRVPPSRHLIEAHDSPIAAFIDRQKYIASEYCGVLDPTDFDEYIQLDGFKALEHVLKDMSPEQVIDEITRSGLRGRGGAGYPTGLKWSHVQAEPGPQKYVVGNGDEGDPGAFMDRMLLESYPLRIIEGITIAAYAVDAHEAILYIREEYPVAVRLVGKAIRELEERKLLGENILDTGFSLNVRIMKGAGAFVCGEETALLASIEGRRGMPRLRPPYPAHEGLWGKPTLINNVETLALVPWIIRNGADAFAALGTAKSKGTKVFALAGKVAHGALIEVPMGITLREIIEEIGGGIDGGKRFKAVQVGGPSGGCIPAEHADITVDFEALTDAGAMMGSGGLVVLDEGDCMVDIARYFLDFTQNQSCGKCTFCRVGTRRMLDILERLCCGEGRRGDLEELERLAHDVKRGSLCGLGSTAPNPILTTLEYFRDEYEAHIDKRCPAGWCKALVTYSITDDCIGCTLCAQKCPADAIVPKPYEVHEIDTDLCVRCGTCKGVCPAEAVKVE